MGVPHEPPEPAALASSPPWWQSSRFGHVFRELVAVAPPQPALGFPRPAAAHGATGHALVRLGSARGGAGVDLLLPYPVVSALADRVLGGSASLSEATALGTPRAAELGVVAYLCARLAAAADAGWVVRDVRHSARELAPEPGALYWPVGFDTELGPLAVGVIGVAEHWPTPLATELVLTDDVPLPQALATGDVVLASSAPLTLLTTGLCGPVLVRVAGLADELAARIGDGAVWGLSAHRSRSRAAELSIATRELAPSALAGLLQGSAPWPIDGEAPARLRRAGKLVAQGPLVWLRGELGLRITQLFP